MQQEKGEAGIMRRTKGSDTSGRLQIQEEEFHALEGSKLPAATARSTIPTRTKYTKFAPITGKGFFIESENMEFAIAGPIARTTLTVIWLRPFTAPREERGPAVEMKMNTEPSDAGLAILREEVD